jgi:glycosyltransferase involved in cell wall biosynthesis
VTLLNRWLKLSPEQRAAMGVQARRTFEARYDMKTNAQAIVRVFESAQEGR